MKTEEEIKEQIVLLERQREISNAAIDGAIQMLKWAITPAPVTQEADNALSV